MKNLLYKCLSIVVAVAFFLGMSTAIFPISNAQAATVLQCNGLDYHGNPYTATYVDGRFTQVLFTRPDAPPVGSRLTYDTVNAQGEPIYRGSYLGAADVVLIDLSKGFVEPGSEVSVAVDNLYNVQRGVCGSNAQPTIGFQCNGLDSVGNPYAATYVDGRFTQVLFSRPDLDLPPVESKLTYDTVNGQGEPIYRGSYLGAADVVLIDLSKGNVKPGSEVSVAVDNAYNIQRGVCKSNAQPMVLKCNGLAHFGDPYTATCVDGRFTQVLFSRPDLPPVYSNLTYDTVNGQGEPIYRGSYLGAADVVLIDLSKGNVKPGSEVSVAVDNLYNIQRGVCKY